jgi:ribosomal protein L7Ae-like RNA K-turn-binding protein
MNDAENRESRLGSLLGLARRAGKLLLGQDEVLAELRRKKLLIFMSNDCTSNVARRVKSAKERGAAEIIELKTTDRAALGSKAGIKSAQIVALPYGDGFADKAFRIFYGSGANE